MATRERLLSAAEQLFAERGYHATTMDDIASRADVARATAFNYFPRKDEFLTAWVQVRRDVLAELLALEEGASVATAQRLEHAFAALADQLEADPARNRALTRAWVQAGGPLLAGASASADVFAETIRHGQEHGDIRPEVDSWFAGRILLDAYVGALVRWAADESGGGSLRAALQSLVPVIVEGLATGSGR